MELLCRRKPMGLQSALGARCLARRLELLARREAGTSVAELAYAYGVTTYQVRSTLAPCLPAFAGWYGWSLDGDADGGTYGTGSCCTIGKTAVYVNAVPG